MAILRTARPSYIQGNYKLYPANYYTTPAVAPASMAGMIGYSQQNLLSQYNYTIQQMAVSPFSVNDKNYIQRIRDKYNLADTGAYDLYGNIGGFLGVGAATALGLGFVNSPKAWKTSGVFSSFNPKVLATRRARDVALASKKDPTKYLYNQAFAKNQELVKAYNAKVDIVETMREAARIANQTADTAKATKTAADAALEAAEQAYKTSSFYRASVKPHYKSGQITAAGLRKIDALDKLNDLRKAADVAEDAVQVAARGIATTTDAVKAASDGMEVAAKTLKTADKAFDTVELGAKATSKAGGFVPIVGIAMDVASLGISAGAFGASWNAGDGTGILINGIATFLDAVALVADFFPGPGDLISIAASVVSMGVTGWYAGSTLGRSLSQEGLIGQGNFFKNLGASVQARPISTTASLMTMFGVQMLARIGNKKSNGQLRQSKWSHFWTATGLGNIGRTAVTMGAMQFVNKQATWVEEQLGITPDDPGEVNFTNGIGIWGDVSDNLFGATMRKSQLAILTDGDASFKELFEGSWGITTKKDDIFQSITFSDVRKGAGVNFETVPILNSAIDIIGETLVDPQNYVEAYEASITGKAKDTGVELIESSFRKASEVVRLKQAAALELDPNNVIKFDPVKEMEEFLVGPEGVFRGEPKHRIQLLRQLIDSYMKDGDKGLRRSLNDMMTMKNKGVTGTKYQTETVNTRQNIEAVSKMFDMIFKENNLRALRYTDAAEVKLYQDRLNTLAQVIEDVRDSKVLTTDQDKIKAEANKLVKRLEAYYGDKDSPLVLVDKFVKDLDIELSNGQLRSLYGVSQDIQFHTDLAGDAAGLSTWLFMPMQKILGSDNIRKSFKALSAFGRYVFATKNTSAKTIYQVGEAIKKLKQTFTTADIKPLLNELPENESHLDNLIKNVTDDTEIVQTTIKELGDATEAEHQRYVEQEAQIKEYEKALKEQGEELEVAGETVYIPSTTSYGGTNDYIYIKDEADANKNIKEAIAFEDKVNAKIAGTGVTFKQFLRRNKNVLEVKRYEAQKIAAGDYYRHVIYKTIFDASKEQQQYLVSLLSSLNNDIYHENIELLKAHGYYRTYFNSKVERSSLDLTKESARKHITVRDKKLAEITELEKQEVTTKETLDKMDEQVKAKEEELAGLKGEDRTAFISMELDELKKSKDVLFKQWAELTDNIKRARASYEHVGKIIVSLEDRVTKMEAYNKAKAEVEARGETWDQSKHFDKETMFPDLLQTPQVFDKLKWDEETELLTEIHRILRKSGVVYKYILPDGSEKIIEFGERLVDLPAGTSLQVEYKSTLTAAFYGVVADVLSAKTDDILFANMFKELKGADGNPLNFENWIKLGPEQQSEYVIQVLKEMNLTKTQQEMLDGATVRTIVSAISRVVLSKGLIREPISGLNENIMRRVVMYNLTKTEGAFKQRYNAIFKNVNELQEKIDNLRKEADNKGGEEKQILASVINYHVESFNRYFSNMTAYKFVRDSVITRNVKDVSTDLFASITETRGSVLPEWKNIKAATKDPQKSFHTLEDILVEYVESEGFKTAMDFAEPSIEHAKLVSSKEAPTTEDEAYTTSRDAAIEAANEEAEHVAVVKDQVVEQAKDIVAKDKKYNMKGVKILNNLDKPSKIAKQPFATDIKGDRKTQLRRTQRELFGRRRYNRDYTKTVVELSPLLFFMGQDDMIPKGYYNILKEFSRTSAGQNKAVRIFAEYLYHVIKSSKGTIKLDPDSIRKSAFLRAGLNLDTETGKKEYFVRQVLETYRDSNDSKVVRLIYANKAEANGSTALLKGVIFKQVADYANTHKDDAIFDTYDKDLEGYLTINALKEFAEDLGKAEDTDKELTSIKDTIWEKSTDIFERAKVAQNYKLGNVLKRLDLLHGYERQDVLGLSESYWTVSYDVVNKLAYNTPKMLKLLDAIIKYDGKNPTGLIMLDVIKLLDDDITEDYEGKEPFYSRDYVGVKIEDGKVYLQKKDNTFTSLFNVVYKQRVSIRYLRSLIDKMELTPEVRAQVELSYTEMINDNKSLMNYTPIDLNKDVFKESGGTDEEWQFLQDNPELNSIYQMLVTDMNLKYSERDVKKATNAKEKAAQVEQIIKNMRLLYDPNVFEMYKRSFDTSGGYHDMLEKSGILEPEVNAQQRQKIAFGYLVLKSRSIPKATKELIINNIFFYGAYIGKADYTDKRVAQYKRELKTFEGLSDLENKNKAKILENKIKLAEEIRANMAYGFLEDPKERAEYFLKNPEKLADFFGFYRDTDDKDDANFIMALNKEDKFILIEKTSKAGEPNYEIETKGVPDINLAVHDIINDVHDKAVHDEISSRIDTTDSSAIWYLVDRSKIVDVIVGKDGNLLIVTKDSITKDKKGKEYINVDSALHNSIKEKRSALIAELNKERSTTGIKGIYTMSERQYKEMNTISKDDLPTEPTYRAIEIDGTGKYYGETPQLVTTYGTKSLTDAYILDVIRLDGVEKKLSKGDGSEYKSYDEVLDALEEYTRIYNNRTVISEAYHTHVPFSATQTLRDFQNTAKSLRVYYHFVETLKANGIDVDNKDLDLLTKTFYKWQFIKSDETGEPFDLDKLQEAVKPEVWSIYEKAGMIDSIKDTLRALQVQYGDTDIMLNGEHTLPAKFLDTLKSLTGTSAKLMRNVGNYGKKLQNEIFNLVDKQYASGYKYGLQLEEGRDRLHLNNLLLEEAGIDYKDQNGFLRNPVRNADAFKKAIKDLKHDFNTNRNSIMNTGQTLTADHKRERTAYNATLARRKENRLNMNVFWSLYKTLNRGVPSKSLLIQIDSPELRSVTDDLFRAIQKYQLDPTSFTSEQLDAFDQLFSRGVRSIEGITSPEQVYNLVINNYLATYITFIKEHIAPSSYELDNRMMWTGGEAAEKLLADYDATMANKKRYKLNTGYRIRKTDPLAGPDQQETVPIEKFNGAAIEVILDKIGNVKEVSTKLMDTLEAQLFNKVESNKLAYKGERNVLEALLKENEHKKSLPPSLAEYYQTILDKDDRVTIEHIINARVFRKETVDLTEGEMDSIARALDRKSVNQQQVIKDAYDILKKQGTRQKQNTYTPQKVWTTFRMPLLDNSREFMTYFLTRYLTTETTTFKQEEMLRLFGISGATFKFFMKETTLRNAVRKAEHDMSADQMYAFVHAVNTAKMLYLTEEAKNLGKEKLNFLAAWYEHTRKPVRNAQTKIKNMNTMGGFSGVYDSNIIKAIYGDSSFIFEALNYVKKTNETLQQHMIPMNEKVTEINSTEAKFVRQAEAQFLTEARKTQRDLFKVFFKNEEAMSPQSRQYFELIRELNEAPLHIISEANAEDINSVSSTNKLYNEIMHGFDGIAKLIMGGLLKPKDFIRAAEVAVSIRTLRESKEVAFWANVFDDFVRERKADDGKLTNTDIDEAIKKAVDIFKDGNRTMDIRSIDVKAVIGMLLYRRFDGKYRVTLTAKDFKDYSKTVVESKYKLYLSRLGRISYRLQAAENDDEVAMIIFGKTLNELEKSTEQDDIEAFDAIQLVKSLRGLIKAGLTLTPEILHDTYVGAIKREQPLTDEDNFYTRTFGHANSMLVGGHKTLERFEGELRDELDKAGITIHELSTVQTKRDAVESDIIFKERELEAVQDLLDTLKEQKTKELQEIYMNIIMTHPELLTEYIEKQEAYIKKRTTSLEKAKEKIVLNYAEVLREEVDKRLATEEELAKLKASFRFKTYNNTRRIDRTKAGQKLWDEMTDEVRTASGFKDSNDVILWLNKVEKEVKDLDALIASYKTTPIEIAGKNASKYLIKKYTKDIKALAKQEQAVEDLKNKLLLAEEDILADDDMIKEIVVDFSNRLFKQKEATSKQEFSDLLEKAEVPAIDVKQQAGLVKYFEERLYNVEKQLAKYLAMYNEQTYIKKLYPRDNSNNQYLGMTKRTLDRLQEKKKSLDTILTNLNANKPTTTKEVLTLSLQKFLDKNGLDFENSLDNLIDYLSGESLEEIVTDIVKAEADISTIKKSIRTLEGSVKTYDRLLELPGEIENQKNLNKQYLINKEKAEADMEDAFQRHAEKQIHGNSNLGTYKNLKGLPKVEDIHKQDADLLDSILDTVANDPFQGGSVTVKVRQQDGTYIDVSGVPGLKAAIQAAGDYDIHNPVVDDLITYLNYLEQTGKTSDDEFFVFDMETIRYEGQDLPYQMTILHNEKGGKITIQTVYFNSIAFHREGTADTPTITQFKEDLFNMYSSRIKKHKSTPEAQYKLTELEEKTMREKAEDDAERIISTVKTQKNNPEFVQAYLSIFNDANNRKIPIVTHAGERFDIPNYTTFINRYANTLLTNMYYSHIYKSNPDAIMDRYNVSSFSKLDDMDEGTVKDVISEMTPALEKLMLRMKYAAENKTYEQITDSEWKQVKLLNEGIYRASMSRHIRVIEEQMGIHLDDRVKDELFNPTTGQIAQVKTIISDWLKAKDLDKQVLRESLVNYYKEAIDMSNRKDVNHDYTKELEDKIDKLLDEVETTYNDIRHQNKTITYDLVAATSRRAKVVAGLFTPEETSVDYPAQEFIEGYIRQNESLLSTKEMLETLSPDTLEQTIKNLDEEGERLEASRLKLKSTIALLEDQIDNTNTDAAGYLTDLTKFAKKIQSKTSRLFYQGRKAVSKANIQLRNQGKNNTIDPINESVLNYGMARTVEEMNDVVVQIEALIKISQALLAGDKTKDIDTEGLYDAQWFKYETTEQVKAAQDDLKKSSEAYDALIKDMTENKTYADLKAKALLDVEFSKVEETQRKFLTELIEEYGIIAKKYGIDVLEIEYKTDHAGSKDVVKDIEANKETVKNVNALVGQVEKLIADSGLLKETYLKNNPDVKRLLDIVKVNGAVSRLFDVLRIRYTDKQKIYDEYRKVFIMGLEQSKNNVDEKLKAIAKYKIGDVPNNAIELLNSKLKSLLGVVNKADLLQEELQINSILNIVSGRGKTTDEMSPEEFTAAATRRMDKEFVDALDDPFAVRLHDTALRHNNKKALMMKEDQAYYKPVVNEDGSMTFVFSFFDQTTQTTNQITLNTQNPRALKSNFKYVYHYANQPLSRPREVLLPRLQFREVEENYGMVTKRFLNVTKTIDNFYKEHTPGISSGNVYKRDGKDGSFESLKRAMLFYQDEISVALNKLPKGYNKLNNAQKVVAFQKAFKPVLEKSTNSYELHLKALDLVDMTKRTEDMFIEYIKTARLLAGKQGFRDAAGVYQGLSDKLLSKYSSLVPGKILNLIAPEFATDFIMKYDDEALHEKNIDLYNSSEGSMGTSFMERTPYSTHLPFKHNTNSIRIGLSNTQQYKLYTSVGLINALYLKEDEFFLKNIKEATYDNDVTKYIDDLKPANGDYNRRVVMMKNKTLTTYDKVADADKKKIIMEYNEDVIKRLGEILTKRHAFVPKVVSREDKAKYLRDEIHKRGVNLRVTFVNDARAFEDVILFDYDDAMALGWNKGYKTWLGLYGFKGGVRLVKGLRAQYGTSLVASATSVVKRGAYGALVEMFISNMNDAYASYKAGTLSTKDKYYSFIKAYINPTSAIHKYVTFEDGFAIVKPNVNYTEFFNEKSLFPDFAKLEGKEKYTGIFDMYLTDKTKGTVKYNYTMGNKDTEVETDASKGWQGSLYVSLDSEHITEHLANKAELKNYGGIAVAQVDQSGTVLNGVVLSESVLYTMLAKSSDKHLNWSKAFYGEDDPKRVMFDNPDVNLYNNIAFKGIDFILSDPKYVVRVDGTISVGETIKNLEKYKMNSNIITYIREYLSYDYLFTDAKRTDSGLTADIHFRRVELNKKIRQEAHDRLTGDHGLLKSSLFKKHFGGRQQLLANTDLKRGNAVTNEAIWKNNMEYDKGWANVEDYPMAEFTKDIIEHVYESTGKTKTWRRLTDSRYLIKVSEEELNDVLVLLHRSGIINGTDSDAYKLTKDKDGYKISVNTIRKYGWMLTMRSPVQDYNAVSMIKIIGYHDHNALEADKYLYKRIGGDNDGDTLGMIAINKEKYEYLRPLDATEESFYDKGYFDAVDEDYIVKDGGRFITPAQPDIKGIDIMDANIGKHAISTFVDTDGKKKKIRANYTPAELFIQTFPEHELERIITDKDSNKPLRALYKDLEAEFKGDIEVIRTYTNEYIRRMTGGYDFSDNFKASDYADAKKMLAFLTKEKAMENVLGRYAFDRALKDGKIKAEDYVKLTPEDVYQLLHTLDQEDQEMLKKDYDMYTSSGAVNKANKLKVFLSSKKELTHRIEKEIITNKIINRLFQVTVERVQSAKVGINYFGGNRKNQMSAIMLSRFFVVNKDSKSSFWDAIDAYDSESKAITPASLKIALDKLTEAQVKKHLEASLKGIYKVTDEDVKEFMEEAYDVINDAHSYAVKATDIFTALSKALDTAKTDYTFVDFFKEAFIDDAELLPTVKLIKDSGLEKLETWQLEWIKVQYWGANKKEANTFIKGLTDAEGTKERVQSYSDGYRNEQIITRREFKTMSDKATEIIGFAKHFGNDVQTYKYMRTYMEAVLAEAKARRVRLTNLDSSRSYINYAIAMNRNPFEDDPTLDITDTEYTTLQRGRKTGTRDSLQKSYPDKNTAKINLVNVSKDNFDIQVLGRLGVHATIHDHVKDALTKFLDAFKDVDVADDNKLVEAAAKAEEFAKALVEFNVSGYKIRDYILSYMYNYNYINNVLRQNNKSMITFDEREDLVVTSPPFMELLFKVSTRYHRERYEALLKTEAPLVNSILQSELEVDSDYYQWDDEGGLSKRTDNNSASTNLTFKDNIHGPLGAIHDRSVIPTVLRENTTHKENKILKVFLNELELNVSNKHTNFSDTLNELMREYDVLRTIYYTDTKKKQELKDAKYDKSPEKTRQAIMKKKLDYTLIEDDLKKLFSTRADLIKNKQTLKEETRKLEVLEGKLADVESKQQVIHDLTGKDGYLPNLKTIDEQIASIDAKIAANEQKILDAEDNILSYVFNSTFSEMIPLLHTQDGSTVKNLYFYSKPKLLTDKDVDEFHDTILMNMHHTQSAFLSAVEGHRNPTTGEIDFKEMYEWMVSRYDFVRLTMITKPDDDEGLLRRLTTQIFKEEIDNKGKKKSKFMFNKPDELYKFMEKLQLGEAQTPIRFNGTNYAGIDPQLDTKRWITPTLKEINIRNADDLELLYKAVVADPDNERLIGFVMINDIMDAYDQAYIPYKQTGFGSKFISKMLIASKFLQRLNVGFLMRNWMDTWYQLYTEAAQKYGVIGVLWKTPEILKIMRGVSHIKSVYHRVSLDRILYLTAFKGHYEELQGIVSTGKPITPEQTDRLLEIIDINIRVLESYRDAKLDTDEFSTRIMTKQQQTKSAILNLKRIRTAAEDDINTLSSIQSLKGLEHAVTFIGSMKFAEFFVMYDKLADVFDATQLYQSKNVAYINHIRSLQKDNWEDFKTDLFQTSAFMQTHAQRDEYQTKQNQIVKDVLVDMLTPDVQRLSSYEDIAKEIDRNLAAETSTFVGAFNKNMRGVFKPILKAMGKDTRGGDIKGLYSWMTADTETSGRLVGFFLDQHLHDLTFEQSVNKSLTRFFDYGALSPIEKNMLADIPYLSFPIRSINNWINRLNDPRMLRHLTDVLDGIYGQYADEDGQYSEYVRYQMANGWVPIAGGVGLRLGNGAFDIMDLISNPSEQIEMRRGPIGRMMSAMVDYIMSEEKDGELLTSELIRQSAATGFATRGVNQLTAMSPGSREGLKDTPVIRNIADTRLPKSIMQGVTRATTASFWYDNDYNKYTPKKYQYGNGNGRYKYYENLYKDWFTKYGRMRVPKVDPYSLVKEIQWNNYVRAKQSQYRR